MKVVVDGWAKLKKADIGLQGIETIRRRFTFVSRATHPKSKDQTVLAYRETMDEMWIPRDDFMRNRRLTSEPLLELSEGSPRVFDSRYVPRPSQVGVVDELVLQLREMGADGLPARLGGVMNRPTGTGKTILMLELIAQMGVTTVVLIHRPGFLIDQWMKRIKGDPKKDKPGILPHARVGVVKQKKCDFGDDFDIVLVSVPSLVRNPAKYPKEFFEWPGLLLFDEVHVAGAPKMNQALPLFPTRYKLGASATKVRRDGCDPIYLGHIGARISDCDDLPTNYVVKMVPSDWDPQPNPLKKAVGELPVFVQKKKLYHCWSRTKQIVGLICRAAVAKRKQFIFSDSLQHLAMMEEALKPYLKGKLAGVTVSQFIGGKTLEELEEAEEADVIFGTYQMAETALDIEALDTLVLAAPRKEVTQAVGRVLRMMEGQKQIVIVDIDDSHVSEFFKMLKRGRVEIYEAGAERIGR